MSIPDTFVQADALGIRLEIVNGLPIWEAQPVYRHQKHVDRIAQSLRQLPEQKSGQGAADRLACGCISAKDVYIQFPNGLKRPDISIFCQEPPEEEQDSVLTTIPEAVIEVVSKGYEAKDLEVGPPFYLSQGVKDVLVFDPATLLVLHLRHGNVSRQLAPVEIDLACGCRVSL
ncbi:Uma2 family endonuclease [Thiorhodovibrio frisius]|uniref:Putative restriction endonuclease domain-containing protein n=1 Tax=Thiorhodovibrio frisius TaxID=631362 RepID=H8Z689_9GAMM|nr:Uma2 family endonuclease [Thiorhodovibrio frisius]EIC19656.1 hypothetical protein Thi970DRAFT_03246 [Thiorhodovibrio frisius]WPL20376.1 hypothetical protein Thiofri_00463 [Thiorhodovibrio frisius]